MGLKINIAAMFAVCWVVVAFAESVGTNEVVVDVGKVRFPTAPDLWGIFFEDIDLSLDGGVYAEMVRNRSFEDGHGNMREFPLGYWDPVGKAECFLDATKPISPKNRYCACVRGQAGAGIANQGYFGYGIRKGMEYRLSVALTLAANDADPQARLVFRMKEGGEMFMDCVSLFPADAVAGLFRRDLVEKLKALKPSFMRSPGGCWVRGRYDEGCLPLEDDDRLGLGAGDGLEHLEVLVDEWRWLPRISPSR